jgi:hypothetical protein
MGNRRLRELDVLLDVRGARADSLARGTGFLFPKCLQDAAAGRVGNGVEKGTEIGAHLAHDRRVSEH